MRVPQPDYDTQGPETDIRKEADAIIARVRGARLGAPLRRVKAWGAVRAEIPVVSALEVWNAWQRFKAAQTAALAGGSTDDLMELHEDWLRLSKAWLNAPSCQLVND